LSVTAQDFIGNWYDQTHHSFKL